MNQNAAAATFASFENGDVASAVLQSLGQRQTRQAGPDNRYIQHRRHISAPLRQRRVLVRQRGNAGASVDGVGMISFLRKTSQTPS